MVYLRMIVILLLFIIIFPALPSVYDTAFGKTIGFQSSMETPKGKIIRCAGNLLLTPSSVCVGTNMNDTIVDPLHSGTVFGFKGDDKFQGLLGSETVFGGSGNDAIQAGNGSSTLFGNDGDDTLVGGGGPNILFGEGVTFMYGGNGDDQLIGGVYHEVMIGGPGNNTFVCSGQDDLVVDFKPGEDKMQGNCVLI
jgi:Ca2+-binding RTX toxin-like protein